MKLFKNQQDKIKSFWLWFASESQGVNPLTDPRFQSELSNRLRTIHRDLVWGGTPPDTAGVSRLDISAGGIRELISIVIEVVKSAPDLPRWNIVAFRQPMNPDELEIGFGDHRISAKDVSWVEVGRTGDLRDLDIYVPCGDPRLCAEIGFLMLDHVLGEFLVMTRLGGLEFKPASASPIGAHPLSELPSQLSN